MTGDTVINQKPVEYLTVEQEERFRGYVDASGEPGYADQPCWVWTGPKNKSGYGVFSVADRSYAAHRMSKAIAGDAPSLDQVVRHMCHNRACVNPAHLINGTHAENMRDMVEAGRSYRPIGEFNGRAKCSEATAIGILNSAMPRAALADHAGISIRQVTNIRNGARWGRITGKGA